MSQQYKIEMIVLNLRGKEPPISEFFSVFFFKGPLIFFFPDDHFLLSIPDINAGEELIQNNLQALD